MKADRAASHGVADRHKQDQPVLLLPGPCSHTAIWLNHQGSPWAQHMLGFRKLPCCCVCLLSVPVLTVCGSDTATAADQRQQQPANPAHCNSNSSNLTIISSSSSGRCRCRCRCRFVPAAPCSHHQQLWHAQHGQGVSHEGHPCGSSSTGARTGTDSLGQHPPPPRGILLQCCFAAVANMACVHFW